MYQRIEQFGLVYGATCCHDVKARSAMGFPALLATESEKREQA
jgi:hypothetical protein